MHETILGIDPGTREMGVAVLQGERLLASGVHTLRNGRRPYDLIGQVRSITLSYIREYVPTVVAIEKPLARATHRAALVSVIVQELHGRSRELGLRVVELSPREVRQRLVGNEYATKLEVARALAERFPELKSKVPLAPKRAALGLKPRDKYWLHMFDALAVAVSV